MRGTPDLEQPATLTPGRTRAVLAVVALSLMTVVSAVSGLNVAIPDLARSTGASQTELTWIVDAYTVVFAGLLFLAGAIGDRFGRKRLLAAGLLLFGLAAALGTVTDDPTRLIAVRALMGVGAAAIMPTTLSIITTSFPEAERPKAIGVWVGMAGGGAVLGLFGAGLLLQYFAWNSFFALNVALAALGLAGTLAVVPDSNEGHVALDVVGGLLSLVAVGGIVFGIIEGPERGWSDALTLAPIAVGLLAGAAFVTWELRQEHPLLDPRLFAVRGFTAGSLTITVQFFCSFGMFFVGLQYLQFVAGYSPLKAAAACLPLPLVMLPTARTAPHVAARIGFRRVVPVGLLFSATGLFVLSRLALDSPYAQFAIGLGIFAFGMGLAGTPSTTAVTASLPPSKQGVASAVNDTARELGSAFGIAILGSALNQSYRDAMRPVVDALPQLPAQAQDVVLRSVAFTSSPELGRLGPLGQQLAAAARAAFVDGIGTALGTAAVIAVIGAVVVALIAPRGAAGRPSGETAEKTLAV